MEYRKIVLYIGFISLISSTFIYSYQIPKIDDEISSEVMLEKTVRHNLLLGTIYQAQLDIINTDSLLMNEINDNSQYKNDIENRKRDLSLMKLVTFYIAIYNRVPSDDEKRVLNNMTYEEITKKQVEMNSYDDFEMIHERHKEHIRKMGNEKIFYQQYALVLQIIGLVIINLNTEYLFGKETWCKSI